MSDETNLMKQYGPNESILSVKPIKPSSIYVSTSSIIYLPTNMNDRDDLIKYLRTGLEQIKYIKNLTILD